GRRGNRERDAGKHGGRWDVPHAIDLAHDGLPCWSYCSRSLIFSMPALAQRSSLTGPAEPPTPIAPTVCLPNWMRTPPGARMKPGMAWMGGTSAGFPVMRCAIWAEVVSPLE